MARKCSRANKSDNHDVGRRSSRAVSKKFGSNAPHPGRRPRPGDAARACSTSKTISSSFLVGTPKGMLQEFDAELCTADWTLARPQVQVKVVQRDGEAYVLARSKLRRKKERAMRHRQLRGLRDDLRKLSIRVSSGNLKDMAKVQQAIGRLAERWPAAWRFACVTAMPSTKDQAGNVTWNWLKPKLKAAMMRDGAYLLLSDQTSWTAEQLWSTYIQLTRAEDAFRTLKSQELLRPIWHQLGNRVKGHVFVCVLAYALWKALEHMLRAAGEMSNHPQARMTKRGQSSPKDRLTRRSARQPSECTTSRSATSCWRRWTGGNWFCAAWPVQTLEQAELLAALKNRSCAERLMSDVEAPRLPADNNPPPESGGGKM